MASFFVTAPPKPQLPLKTEAQIENKTVVTPLVADLPKVETIETVAPIEEVAAVETVETIEEVAAIEEKIAQITAEVETETVETENVETEDVPGVGAVAHTRGVLINGFHGRAAPESGGSAIDDIDPTGVGLGALAEVVLVWDADDDIVEAIVVEVGKDLQCHALYRSFIGILHTIAVTIKPEAVAYFERGGRYNKL